MQTGDLLCSQQCKAQYKSEDICKRIFLYAKVKEHVSIWPHRIEINVLKLTCLVWNCYVINIITHE
jgi:hypothetical protein